MNIYVYGERKIKYLDSKNQWQDGIQSIDFGGNVIQTPTDISKKIVASKDKLKTYSDYVKSIARDEFIKVYADDDYMHDKEPVKIIMVNYALEMLDRFVSIVNDAKDNGYEIHWSMQ